VDELCTRGAGELAALIRTGETTAAEVVDAHLARIAEANASVNAVTRDLAETARSAAAAVDRAIAAGEPAGPLAGVPFTVKDSIDVAGSPTTWGSAALAGQVASEDAPAVARLREAGAIPIARTNMPDFAFRWHTESGIAGHTLNPWDPSRTPGGSSGGEAAALATGMTPLGLGTDLGGSLRLPSQMCGTAALRPTLGRVAEAACTEPSEPPISIQLLSVVGPMARRIDDLRLALGIVAAPDARDPRLAPAPPTEPEAEGPLGVAVVLDPLGAGVDPHVRAGVERAAAWLADAGYEVAEVEPPAILDAVGAWMTVVGADVRVLWPHLEPLVGEGAKAFVSRMLAAPPMQGDRGDELAAWQVRLRLGAAWSRFALEHPLVLAPVACERPWPVGDDIERIDEIAFAMRMVVPVNLLGLPACAVPVGCDDGLPQGVQLIGPRFREDLVLDAAEAVERRAPALTPIDARARRPDSVGADAR
jgi:amidase